MNEGTTGVDAGEPRSSRSDTHRTGRFRQHASPQSIDVDALFAGLRASRGLLVAVSGGPDSTALLLLIDRWRKATRVPVAVATVDHRLRKNADREAAAVAALCAARGLPHATLVREGAPFRTRIQERSREARYALLCEYAVAVGADTIVTGHHADDQAETILMRLMRGSGVAGLAGMAAPARRGTVTIARPLLCVPKTALFAVCRAENTAFSDDPSNGDEAFRRTALRRLAPVLAAEGLDADNLGRLGRRAARVEAALRWAETLARERVRIRREPSATVVPADAFLALPEEFAIRVLADELRLRSAHATVRLERLENLVAGLRIAVARGTPFAATLAGCAIRLRADAVHIAPAPPRRRPPRAVNGGCHTDPR